MNMKKYYSLCIDTKCEGYTRIVTPQNRQITANGVKRRKSKHTDLFLELRNDFTIGAFLPIMISDYVDCEIVSQEFKDAVTPFVKDYASLEFIPVNVYNENNECRQYYLLHFKQVEHVIDFDHSKCDDKITDGSIQVSFPILMADRVQHLHMFKITSSWSNKLTISEDVYDALSKVFKTGIRYEEVPVI